MMTVAQAMQDFISSLELKDREDSEARRQRDVVKDHLLDGLTVEELFISGSFGRNTAIRPLKDIDLFLVLERKAHEDLRNGTPRACLDAVHTVLDKAYQNKTSPRTQARSVNIEFVGTGIGFDVVPAFRDPNRDDVYTIPDSDIGRWIDTNPRIHKEHSTRANDQAGKKAKPLVKALKRWNALQQPKALRSFHIELMVYNALLSPPASYAEGLEHLFTDLSERVMYPCPDPAGLGSNVDAGYAAGTRERAQALFRNAAGIARHALQAAADGRTEEAHFHWRSLLGESYPERGKEPSRPVAPPIVAPGRSAPDAPDKRFG